MNTHTLIPEAGSYGIVILVVYSLSAFSVTLQLYYRRLNEKGVNFALLYSGVMVFTISWGVLVLGPEHIFGDSVIAWVLSLPIGLVVGSLAGWSDRAIIRHLSRSRSMLKDGARQDRRSGMKHIRHEGVLQVRSTHIPVSRQIAKKRSLKLSQGEQNLRQVLANQQPGLWSLIAVAGLEEIIYRGLLVKACFLLPNSFLITGALVGTVMAFALSHIWYGWSHVFAKLPLGVLALLTAIGFGTVLPAIVAHMIFNRKVWIDRSTQPIFTGPS